MLLLQGRGQRWTFLYLSCTLPQDRHASCLPADTTPTQHTHSPTHSFSTHTMPLHPCSRPCCAAPGDGSPKRSSGAGGEVDAFISRSTGGMSFAFSTKDTRLYLAGEWGMGEGGG
jgi:hypothetical protein